VLLCWEVGNYPGEAQAQTAAKRLPDGLKPVGVAKTTASQVAGFYVMVPPAGSQEDAQATLVRLKQKGIADTWLFRSGPYENAISLGLFSNRTNAERQAGKVRAKGFEIELREKRADKEVYRLRVSGRDARAVEKFAGGTHKRIPCP
jgi:hypothetical protein